MFLRAEWRKLLMANYVVPPEVLQKYVPAKTELDLWNGQCYVSLVGFMFLNTRVKGLRVPFHVNFEEVNLRFYVRHLDGGEWKRGVVFVQEIVPKPALAWVARLLYKEKYVSMPMGHAWETKGDRLSVAYSWKKDTWHSLSVAAENTLLKIGEGSEEEFITEHYWGYTALGPGQTAEYGVEHPKWDVYKPLSYDVSVGFGELYGAGFAFLDQEKPVSVLLAEGSDIVVKGGRQL